MIKPIHEKHASNRQKRIGMIMRRALSNILFEQDYKIIISEITLSRDLRCADIFILPAFEIPDQQKQEKIKLLEKNMPKLRHQLSQRIYLKYMPKLRFHLDCSFGKAERFERAFPSR